MKINGHFLKNLNVGAFKSGKKKLFKSKKTMALTAASILLIGSLIGCSVANKNKSAEQTAPASTVSTNTETGTSTGEEEKTEDDFTLLADRLEIKDLTMTDNLSASIAQDLEEQLDALGIQGPMYSSDKVYTDSDGIVWVDENEYQEYINGGSGVHVGSGYLAPDGNVWESEEAYQEYINGQTPGDVITDGDYYEAPDGSIWSSKEEYDKYVAGGSGEVVQPGTGEVVEPGEGYQAPDGSYWSSESDYLEYINGQSSNDNNDYGESSGFKDPDGNIWSSEEEYWNYINGSENNYDDNYNDNYEGDVTYEDDVYVAPDGSTWSSESDYLNYVNSLNSNQNSQGSGSATDEVYTDTNYYVAPDGSIWESESDYLAFVNSTNAPSITTEATVDVVPESEYVEEEVVQESVASDYYVDPDGNYWASEADYLAYIQNEAQFTK